MTCAQLGLEPNTPLGEAYLIPRGDSVSFQPGYLGLVKLAWQSGQVAEIYAEDVHENDHFRRTLGLHRDLQHEPAEGDRGAYRGSYAVVRLVGGGVQFAYMTAAELAEHRRRYSQASGKSPWDEGTGMHRKTVLLRALRLVPKSTELAAAVALDGSERTDVSLSGLHVPRAEVDEVPEAEVVVP
jgi:recombination protein RecT